MELEQISESKSLSHESDNEELLRQQKLNKERRDKARQNSDNENDIKKKKIRDNDHIKKVLSVLNEEEKEEEYS